MHLYATDPRVIREMPIGLPLCTTRMSIELRHLRCFPAIAEESSVTRAAVAAFDEALDAGRLRRWPLRLGHAWSALGPYTTPLLRRRQHEHPDTPLELLRIDDRTAGLTRGDAAVLRGPVTTEPRVAAVTADGPLAARTSLALADLTAGPVIADGDRGGSRHGSLGGVDGVDAPAPGGRVPRTVGRTGGAGRVGMAGGGGGAPGNQSTGGAGTGGGGSAVTCTPMWVTQSRFPVPSTVIP